MGTSYPKIIEINLPKDSNIDSMARVGIFFAPRTKTASKNFIEQQLKITVNNNSNISTGSYYYVSIYTSVEKLPSVVKALLNPSARYEFVTTAPYQILILKSTPTLKSSFFTPGTVYRRMRNLIQNNPSVGIYQLGKNNNRQKISTLHNKLKRDGNQLNARRIQSVARGMPARKKLRIHREYKPGGSGYLKARNRFTLHQAAQTPIYTNIGNNNL